MQIDSIIKRSRFQNTQLCLNEARFGFAHIREYLKKLKDGGSVLEIGCGSGILLTMCSEIYKKLNFDGIEPFADDFLNFSAVNDYVKSQFKPKNVVIEKILFEEFKPNKRYDLIYLVNVFEHLKSWEKLLFVLDDWLTDSGVCVVLCPNYSFPYEPHFMIPIIFNKKTTFKLFENFIINHNKSKDGIGFWSGLNFVKKKDVEKFVKNNSRLLLSDRREVLEQMILRLHTDTEFKKRHKIVGFVGSIMLKLRISKMFNIDFFSRYSPYMKLEFRKIS
jgi:SAM-dependent methyltransferase